MKDFQLMNRIKAAVAVIDKDMNIVYANASFKKRNYLDKAQVTGTKCFTSAYKINENCTNNKVGGCPVAESFQTKQPSSAIHHFWVEDHALVEVITSTPIIEDNGEVNYVIEEFSDMTTLLGLNKGIISTCSYCNKIHDNGEWINFDLYLHKHTGADFSHGICDECKEQLLKELQEEKLVCSN